MRKRDVRLKFTTLFLACSVVCAIPGLILPLQQGWEGVVLLLSMVFMSTAISSQLFYRAVARRLHCGRTPWLQCIGITGITYILFGAFVVLYSFAVDKSSGFEWWEIWAFMGAWSFITMIAVIFTGWLAFPISVLLAFRLKRSTSTVKPNCVTDP